MQNKDGHTALIIAVQDRHIDVLKYLIEANANVNMQIKDGSTACILAAQNRHIDVVNYLTEVNADMKGGPLHLYWQLRMETVTSLNI